jgi:hypothetical protein
VLVIEFFVLLIANSSDGFEVQEQGDKIGDFSPIGRCLLWAVFQYRGSPII